MIDIHNLSQYQLYKLKSIDPALSSNWREVIQDSFSELNQQGRNSLFENILEPRGIYFDSNQNLAYKRAISLKQTLKNSQSNNNDLVSIANHMLKIIDSSADYYNAMQLADEIEIIFARLDSLNLYNLIHEQRNYKKIRTAFLYDLASWIDTIKLEVRTGLRGLDQHMVKSYLKEVFIKQKIQGRDFRKWNSADISFQEFTYLPAFIRNEGKNRKFIVVEGKEYWFLIGSPDKADKNPYSFRRFLYEDSSGEDDNKYVYLTHAVIKKNQINNPQYLSYTSYVMSRFYTLDDAVPDSLLNFIDEIQHLNKRYLQSMLKKRIEQEADSIKETIKKRMMSYEKQMSLLILGKLPRVIQSISNNQSDQDYLFYNLDQLLKQMTDDIEDFRLQPLAKYSTSSEIMSLKLVAIRKLLIKSRSLLCSENMSAEECSNIMHIPIMTIQEKFEEAEASLEELKKIEHNIRSYLQVKEEDSFWQRIKFGRKPKYTLEHISKKKLAIQEDTFASIVRLAKKRSQGMLYLEFECDEIMNENYRHYALADGELGISRLPKILRLPEDRKVFDIGPIRKIIDHNVFEDYQLWDDKEL